MIKVMAPRMPDARIGVAVLAAVKAAMATRGTVTFRRDAG